MSVLTKRDAFTVTTRDGRKVIIDLSSIIPAGNDLCTKTGQWYSTCGKVFQYTMSATITGRPGWSAFFGVISDKSGEWITSLDSVLSTPFMYFVGIYNGLDEVTEWYKMDNIVKARDLYFACILGHESEVGQMVLDATVQVNI